MKIEPGSVIGKPLVVYIDGERREVIGTITSAKVVDGKLFVAANIGLEGRAA